MASFNKEKKIIFIHLPKCAGTYVQHILLRNYGFPAYNYLSYEYKSSVFSYRDFPLAKYFSRDDILEIIGVDDLSEYKKFTIVRNPYNRFISGFEFMKERGFIDKDTTFDEIIKQKNTCNGLVYNHLFCSQSEHMRGWEFDEIGQFETIELDLTCILRVFGFEICHEQSKKNETIYSHGAMELMFDQKFIRFINENFAEDFLKFGYEKIEVK